MTERLTTLLREEVSHLDVPAPAPDSVLARGRGLRRRRRATVGVAGLALLAVVGGGAVTGAQLLGPDGAPDTTEISPMAQYLRGGAYSVGQEVHFGSGDLSTKLDEKVKVLYYTSAGVVARTGDDPWTDSAGPSHYSLITPEGDVTRLDLDLGDRVPATDPEQPLLAWAEEDGDGWAVVVRDVRTDKEVARVRVEGRFTWGGWEAPPVSLTGDVVTVGLDREALLVDWRTGETKASDVVQGGTMPAVAGGRTVVYDREAEKVEVVDVSTGETVLSVPGDGFPYIALSPDGRFAKVVIQDAGQAGNEEEGATVHDLATGEHAWVAGPAWDFGWTPDGYLLRVTPSEVTTCHPVRGTCQTEQVDLGKGEVKIAGNSYES